MKKINAIEANELAKEINIIDVRTVEEFNEKSIESAINIPLQLIQFKHQEVLNKDEEYYVMCFSGARAMMAEGVLSSLGYKVSVVSGGMKDL